MVQPPPHIAVRRERQRAALRRRRRIATLCIVAAVALAGGLLIVLSSGSASRTTTASATSAGPQARRPRSTRVAQPAHHVSRGAAATAESSTIRHLLKLGLPIYCAGPHGNAVAFTFDDGPGPYTYLALRKLTQAGERATFFDVGRSMDNYPGYLPRELRVAAIGDHTYTHPELIALSPAQITWQLQATAEKIRADSGQPVDLFRPPYELHNATVDRIANHLGLLEILWNVDSQDSLGANWAHIITNVEAGLHPGAIIELHENHGQTIRALTTLLPELHRRHLRSVSVPELLDSDPPSDAQVRAGPAGCGLAAAQPGTGG